MKIKYFGTASFQEQPVTGTFALWQPNQESEIAAGARTTILLATVGFCQVDDDGSYIFSSLSTLPPANEFVGVAQVGSLQLTSDGIYNIDQNGKIYYPDKKPVFALIGDSTAARGNIQLTLTTGALTSVGTLATLTQTGHGLNKGQFICIQNYAQPEYNGVFKIVSRASADVVTFNLLSDPAVSPATGSGILVSQQQVLDRNFAIVANYLSDSPCTYGGNFAQGGSRSGHLSRQLDLLLNASNNITAAIPDIVFISTGINDFLNSVAIAEVKTNVLAAIDRLKLAGILPVILTTWPLGTTYASYAKAADLAAREYNSWLKTLNEIVIDAWDICIDKTTNATTWLTNYSSDKIHPELLASYYVAKEIKSKVFGNIVLTNDTATKTNVIVSPLLDGIGGIKVGAAVTGDVADAKKVEVSGSMSVVCSKGLSADGYGESQILAITALAAGETCTFKLSSATALNAAVGGKRISAKVKIKTRAALAIYQMRLNYTTTVDGFVSTNSVHASLLSTGSIQYPEALELDVEFPIFEIPTGATTFEPWLGFTFGAAGTGTIEISNYAINVYD